MRLSNEIRLNRGANRAIMTKLVKLTPSSWAAGETSFLTSRLLTEEACRRIDKPNAVTPSNWNKYISYLEGITIGSVRQPEPRSIEISRDDLFAMATDARISDSAKDWHTLFWNVMAWGTVGDMRNVSRISSFAVTQTTSFTSTLRQAAELSYLGDPTGGYVAFNNDGKIPRLGTAFFSKFLYFSGDRKAESLRCFIYDDRVRVALNIIRGDEPRLTARGYADYSRTVHTWSRIASDLTGNFVSPDELEFRLYLLGQHARTHRNWLQVEVAMHRRGTTATDFEGILTRLIT